MSCELVASFCKRQLNSEDPTPLIRFWNAIPHEDQRATTLIELFGKIQEERIAQLLPSPLKEIYQIKSKQQLADFKLILRDNIKNLRRILHFRSKYYFDPLTVKGENYSWKENKLHNNKSTEDLAKECSLLSLFTEPMPFHFIRALGFNHLDLLKTDLEQREQTTDKLTKTLFILLAQNPKSTPAQSAFFKEKHLIPFQLMLLRYGAVLEGDHFSSWMEEILKWGEKHHTIRDQFINNFKVYHLINLSTTKFFESQTTEDKQKNNQSNYKYIYDSSFRHYLIKKTLNQIVSYVQIPQTIYVMLAGELDGKNGEPSRQLICFYLYFIKKLFNIINPTSTYCSTEILDLGAENPKMPLLNQALNILERLSSKTSYAKEILTYLTYVFSLNHEFGNKMTLEERSSLFQFIYHSKLNYEEIHSLIKFIFENFPVSLRLSVLKAISDPVQAPKSRIECLQRIQTQFNQCYHSETDPYSSIGEIIKKFLKDDSETSQLYLMLADFMRCLFYIDLSEESKMILYNRLKDTNEYEKEKLHQELTDYSNNLAQISQLQSTSFLQKRVEYFKIVYENFLKEYPDNFLIHDLLQKWPKQFKEFDYNVKLIQNLDKLILNIPIEIFVRILLYPIFLPPILDVIEQASSLRQEINQNKEAFFLPPSLLSKVNRAVSSIADVANLIPSKHLRGEHAMLLSLDIFKVGNLIASPFVPCQAYYDCILKTIKFPLCNNKLFVLESTPNCFLASWDKENSKYPILGLTFIRSLNAPESRSEFIPLEVDKSKFTQPLFCSLLETMIETLCQEIYEEKWETKARQQLSENEELEWCLSLIPECKEAYEKYVRQEKNSDAAKETVLALLRFIKRIKIFTRIAILQLNFQDDNKELKKNATLENLVGNDSIHITSENLSLIPQKYRETLCQQLGALRTGLLYSDGNFNIFNLCKFIITNKRYSIQVTMDRCDFTQVGEDLGLKRIHYILKFTLNTTPPHSFSIILSEASQTEKDSCIDCFKLKGLKNERELDNVLRWAVYFLIKKYLNSI